MVRHGKRVFCKMVREAIADEKKGVAFYARLARRAKLGGLPWREIMQARRDEEKHYRWMRQLKSRYCRK